MKRSGSRLIAAAARVLVTVALLATAGFVFGGPAAASPFESAHVHGLGFDVTDGALLLGTHDGLYRLGPGDTRPRKVGTVSYDLMGLAVVGPRSYLASGHPDGAAAKREGTPANLGLIRTDDGGKRWRPVSLHGGVGFHVLRARGRRVLAYDGTHGRLLASSNAGGTWKRRELPSGAADLALGPASGVVAASTSDGLMVFTDDGVSYGRRARDVGPGLLIWPSPRLLLLVDGDGAVLASTDGRVAVLLDGDRILLSRDGGRQFAAVPGP